MKLSKMEEMTQFHYLACKVPILCLTLLTTTFHSADGKDKPNVLLIVVDDLRPTLGCYGHDQIKTPNIDQLAQKSVKFNNAYVQQALCGPSRTSFLTSRRPDTTRLYDFYSYWRTAAGNFTTLPQHFKQNGYYTKSVGKIFHHGKCSGKHQDYPYSWSDIPYIPSTMKYKMKKVCPGTDGKQYLNIVCPVDVASQPEGTLPDIQNANHALNFLKNRSSSGAKDPFFLGVGFYKPHIPLKYPDKYLDLYPFSEIDTAENPNLPPLMPKVAWNPWTDLRKRDDVQKLNVSYPYGPVPKFFQRLMRQSYYAATSYMDYQVGRVLDGLDRYGYSNDTIILFVGDHGWSLGEHQEWSKYSTFEVAVRVPLLVHVPQVTSSLPQNQMFPLKDPLRMKNSVDKTLYFTRDKNPYYSKVFPGYRMNNIESSDNGHSTNALVELVDIFPSLADLTGLPVPPLCPLDSSSSNFCTEGHSFAPVIRNVFDSGFHARKLWKTAAFSQYPRPTDLPQENSDKPRLAEIKIMGYSLRTENVRYTEWISFDPKSFSGNWSEVHARELYLHATDPLEDDNVANKLENKELVKSLSSTLQKGWRKALPKFNE